MIKYTVEVNEEATRWFLDGKLHREVVPAIEYANGDKAWLLNGINLSEQEVNPRTKTKELTITEIEAMLGYSIKVVR